MERKKLSIVILYMCGRKQPLTFINGKGECMLYMTGKKIRKHDFIQRDRAFALLRTLSPNKEVSGKSVPTRQIMWMVISGWKKEAS